MTVDGQCAVARQGKRSNPDLEWETELLLHLDREGMRVPVPLRNTQGRYFHSGLMLMTYLEGRPPESSADWAEVADALNRLHSLTRRWPQRPGWRSSTDLLRFDKGTRINLSAMPPDGVARCRAAWQRLATCASSVVHGDTNPGNILMTADGVALIDWDEAHVDASDLDLVLPYNAAGLDDERHDIAAQASAAWDAAVCWDDAYAVSRLAQVREV